MVERQCRNLRSYQALPLLLVGLWLFGQFMIGCSPATQPTALTQPLQGAATKETKLPTTLAEIVTFSVQGDQVVADIHWRPLGESVELKLLDVPGVTVATNNQMQADYQMNGLADCLWLKITEQDGKEQDVLSIRVLEWPPEIHVCHGHGVSMAKGNETGEYVYLDLVWYGFMFSRWSYMQGHGTALERTPACKWVEFPDLYPEDFHKYVRPLLQKLHTESLTGNPDLWEYQVLSDRIDPWPLDVDATVKQLIQQLADLLPEKRDQASDQLKNLGNPGLAALARLDRSKLSAEQIKELEKVAQCRFLDDQQVKALKTDQKFLLDCLRSPDEDVRIAAAAQLKSLLGREIDYDADDPLSARGPAISKLRHQLFPTTWPTAQTQPGR